MEDIVTCEVCSENFSSGIQDPLMLPCGHTFCRLCLTHMKKNQDFVCPLCRRDHNNIDVNNLPINYKIMTLLTDNTKVKNEFCDTHEENELIYWCRMCQLPLCGLCLLPGDHKDHEVVKVKVFLQEKKCLLGDKLDDKLKQRQSDIKANKHEFQNTLKAMVNLVNINAQLSKDHEIFSKLKSEVKICALSLNDIFVLETKINSTTGIEEVTELQECASATKDETNHKMEFLREDQPKKLSFCIQNNDGRKGELEWQDGKLLMAAFTNKPSECNILLKMPSEVFLELSIKGRYLGQVIISPWYRLRRAQHFAALCIGTFGVSYSGSLFHSVAKMNCPGEYLLGGWYLSYDGVAKCKNLMLGLNLDGETEGEVREGIVFGVAYDDDQSLYGICTREDKGNTFGYSFGEVVSGMDVIKAAVKHDPVTEVTISRCGVVII